MTWIASAFVGIIRTPRSSREMPGYIQQPMQQCLFNFAFLKKPLSRQNNAYLHPSSHESRFHRNLDETHMGTSNLTLDCAMGRAKTGRNSHRTRLSSRVAREMMRYTFLPTEECSLSIKILRNNELSPETRLLSCKACENVISGPPELE